LPNKISVGKGSLEYLSYMIVSQNRLIIGLFVVLLIGAIYFSLERILFSDASYILFRILNFDSLQIQEHRYGSFMTQGFPLIASKLHLPLSTIVVLYSASFNIFYLLVAFLLVYKFREYSLAVLMSFYYVLFVSDTYFWTNNEVHQGVAWMFLFFGAIILFGKKGMHWLIIFPVFTILAFLTIYTHPLLVFPTGFFWLFLNTRKDWPYSRAITIIFSFILVGLAFSKFLLSTGQTSHYDVNLLRNASEISLQKIIHSVTSDFSKEIIRRTIWNYWLIPILLLAGIYSAIKTKVYLPVLLVLFFSAVYYVAICVTFSEFNPFYTESELMPATIILASLFVYYTLPNLKPSVVVAILGCIFLIRIAYIGYASQKWVDRKEWIGTTLKTMRERQITKGIIYEDSTNRKVLMMNWGTPTESIIASALRGDKPQLTFVVDRPENLPGRMPVDTTQMISCFETLTNSSLNKNYFVFDSTKSYQVITIK
jgi:hypothetical protein